MTVDLMHYLRLLEYEDALLGAEEDLLEFAQVTMPYQNDMDDPKKSRYIPARHHRFLADVMMRVEQGLERKIIINLPPRSGKSELCTKRFAAWYMGRHPDHDIIIATYNEKFAHDFSKEIREIINSHRFRQVFPQFALVQQSDERLRTNGGGDMFFLGRRSATTGRGANCIIVDDPTKDDKEVKYAAFREDCWQWFTQTLLSRRHNDRAPIVMTQTRWNDDDIVGRITDPTNPSYSPRFAADFKVISLPAFAEEGDPLGRAPGEVLWPERFGKRYLEEMREANPLAFSALYQCNPTPDDGVYYGVNDIHEYTEDMLPESLRIYVVSDHAVATKEINDPSCLLPFGICERGNAWILPDAVWKRMDGSQTITEMLTLIKSRRPMRWFAEKGHISKALKPFLTKRMQEENLFCPIDEVQPIGDKIQRATSARARASQGKILFPRFAPWWPRAKSELLKFPNARNDDFVDCVSMIGLKLTSLVSPGRNMMRTESTPGTYGHLLKQWRHSDAEQQFANERKGW